jgi:hypothetical protein
MFVLISLVSTSYHSHNVKIGYIVQIPENKNVRFGLNLRLGLGIRLAVLLILGLSLGLG